MITKFSQLLCAQILTCTEGLKLGPQVIYCVKQGSNRAEKFAQGYLLRHYTT